MLWPLQVCIFWIRCLADKNRVGYGITTVCMNVYCLLADAEATDASGLTGQFARVSLKPGAGTDTEEQSWSSMPLVAYQESQTDPLIPHMPCYIDAEVQCSPILVDKETAITDCSVVSLIAFISQVLFICQLFPNWWPLASVLAFSALTLLVGHACKKNWAVGCWHVYLSGVRCRLAYGPADSTATHCLLLQ